MNELALQERFAARDCPFASIEGSVPFDETFENAAGDEAGRDADAS